MKTNYFFALLSLTLLLSAAIKAEYDLVDCLDENKSLVQTATGWTCVDKIEGVSSKAYPKGDRPVSEILP